MNRRRIAFLVPLFAVLAMLLGLTVTTSAAFNLSAQNPHYGNFLLRESEVSGFTAHEIADPMKENGEWIYDSALGVPVYVSQNPWTMFDPEGLTPRWLMEVKAVANDYTGYWKGAGTAFGEMAYDMSVMANSSNPIKNAYEFATGQKTSYQKQYEGTVATANAAYALSTSSEARHNTFMAMGKHAYEAWENPEKMGKLAANVVVTAVTLGEGTTSLAKNAKSLMSKSSRLQGEVAAAEAQATTPKGGAYKDVPADGGQVHHMPADAVSPLSKRKGPGTRMETGDHQQTASWGSSKEAKAYRRQQKELIEQGKFKEAQQMDIDDVRSKFGDKYNEGIGQMEDYTKTLNVE